MDPEPDDSGRAAHPAGSAPTPPRLGARLRLAYALWQGAVDWQTRGQALRYLIRRRFTK